MAQTETTAGNPNTRIDGVGLREGVSALVVEPVYEVLVDVVDSPVSGDLYPDPGYAVSWPGAYAGGVR